jgi:hypothetical protein
MRQRRQNATPLSPAADGAAHLAAQNQLTDFCRLQADVQQRRHGRKTRKRQDGDEMLEHVGQNRRHAATGSDAAFEQAGRDRVDLEQQLAIGERAAGSVVDERDVVRRTFAREPYEIVGGGHVRETSPAACCSCARRREIFLNSL